jgi:hypothetical protein
MTKKNGNSGQGEQIEILRGMWREMKGLNGRIDKTNERLDKLCTEIKSEIGALREKTEAGFAKLDDRFDNFLRGEHGREHAELRERVERIEQHLGLKPTGT